MTQIFLSEVISFHHLQHHVNSHVNFMSNLRKLEITINFNGNFCHLCGEITHYLVGECHLNLHRYHKKIIEKNYRSGTLNSNTVNLKLHLIPSFGEIFARFLSFHV